MIPHEWCDRARERLASHIQITPLTNDIQRGLFLKWENKQITGSFKARGALNKILALQEWERAAGLVAASAGNHGQGVALAGQLTGSPVEIFVPSHAVSNKIASMKRLGASVHLVNGGYAEAESAGRRYARDQRKEFISPYNDGQVIAGQGTVAMEILEQLESIRSNSTKDIRGIPPEIASWIVPTGGGGLISACGIVTGNLQKRPRLIGVQPAASAFTHSQFHNRTQVGVLDNPTLADGLSGAIEEDSITIPLMEKYVDDVVVVSEEAISQAIAFAWYVYHQKIEGSGAVGLAAFLEGLVGGSPCVVVVSGGNIQAEVFEEIVAQYSGKRWD